MSRKRGKIQRKVVTAILLVGIIPGILVVILTYLSGINALKNSIGANFQEMAKETADKIEIIMNREIQDAQSLALSPHIRIAVVKVNHHRNESKKDAETQRRLDDLQDFLKEYQRQSFVLHALSYRMQNKRAADCDQRPDKRGRELWEGIHYII